MSESTRIKNEPLFNCLKQMENAAQGALFAAPHPESDAFKALDLSADEAWKLGCLVGMLVWFRDKSSAAANRVFMDGRA